MDWLLMAYLLIGVIFGAAMWFTNVVESGLEEIMPTAPRFILAVVILILGLCWILVLPFNIWNNRAMYKEVIREWRR